jgi:hypothetical protein
MLAAIQFRRFFLSSEPLDRRDSSVGIATGYWLDDWSSILSRSKRFFIPRSVLWGPPSLISKLTAEALPDDKAAGK